MQPTEYSKGKRQLGKVLLFMCLVCTLASSVQASCNNTNIGNGWTCTISVSAASANSSDVTTSAITSSGNLGIIAIHNYVGGMVTACTPTDSKSNTWNPLTMHAATHASDQIFYAFNPTVGASHTFTCTSGGSMIFPTITVAFFQTAVASPFDVQNGNHDDSQTLTSLVTNSTGPLNATKELLIASCTKQGFDTSSTTAFNSGFATAENQAPVASEATGGILAYLTQAGTGAVNATCTIASADNMAVSIATFKQTGSVPVTSSNSPSLLPLLGAGH